MKPHTKSAIHLPDDPNVWDPDPSEVEINDHPWLATVEWDPREAPNSIRHAAEERRQLLVWRSFRKQFWGRG